MKCEICDYPVLRHWLRLDEFDLYRCPVCSVVQRYAYVGNNRGSHETQHVAETNIDEHAWTEYKRVYYPSRLITYRRVLDYLGTNEKKRLLDVGSAAGWFMAMAGGRGYEVYGIEPSEEVASMGAQYSGRPVQVALIENAPYPNEFFDVIAMFDVLEHTQNPATCLKAVRRLLTNQGVLVIRVPDINGLLPRVSHWLLYITRRRYSLPAWLLWRYHLWGFNHRSLISLLKKMGFEVLHQYSEDAQDISTISRKQWASNPLLSFGVGALVSVSHILRMQDELVVIARRVPD